MNATLIPISVFLFTPEKEGLRSHPLTLQVLPERAKLITTCFYTGKIHVCWDFLDQSVRRKILNLGIDPADAVNGEVAVDVAEVRRHAPDLLVN